MGIKVDLKCDRCGFEWHEVPKIKIFVDFNIYDNIMSGSSNTLLCDRCMTEYRTTLDLLNKAFSKPITNNGSVDQIKVEGVVEPSNEIAYNTRKEMERLEEFRRIQQNVPMKE